MVVIRSKTSRAARRGGPAFPRPRRPLAVLAAFIALAAAPACAETSELRIGEGFGIHYLPFYVMEQEHLVEKQAAAVGMPALKASYVQFSGGGALNDALISGAVDIVGTGVGPFSILWDKTKGNLNVKALAAMGDIPLVVLTNSPRIHSLADLKDGDRIAVPAVRASMQATLLQMAAAKIHGDAEFRALDQFAVTLPHSEATAALLSHNGIVDVHFSVAPYSTRELSDPVVHQIADAASIVGSPMSFNLASATDRFHAANPAVCRIFMAALGQAMDIIRSDRKRAAEIYTKVDKGVAVGPDLIVKVLGDPAFNYTVVPHGVESFAGFMHHVGILKHDPQSWKDLFFPEAQSLEGN